MDAFEEVVLPPIAEPVDAAAEEAAAAAEAAQAAARSEQAVANFKSEFAQAAGIVKPPVEPEPEPGPSREELAARVEQAGAELAAVIENDRAQYAGWLNHLIGEQEHEQRQVESAEGLQAALDALDEAETDREAIEIANSVLEAFPERATEFAREWADRSGNMDLPSRWHDAAVAQAREQAFELSQQLQFEQTARARQEAQQAAEATQAEQVKNLAEALQAVTGRHRDVPTVLERMLELGSATGYELDPSAPKEVTEAVLEATYNAAKEESRMTATAAFKSMFMDAVRQEGAVSADGPDWQETRDEQGRRVVRYQPVVPPDLSRLAPGDLRPQTAKTADFKAAFREATGQNNNIGQQVAGAAERARIYNSPEAEALRRSEANRLEREARERQAETFAAKTQGLTEGEIRHLKAHGLL